MRSKFLQHCPTLQMWIFKNTNLWTSTSAPGFFWGIARSFSSLSFSAFYYSSFEAKNHVVFCSQTSCSGVQLWEHNRGVRGSILSLFRQLLRGRSRIHRRQEARPSSQVVFMLNKSWDEEDHTLRRDRFGKVDDQGVLCGSHHGGGACVSYPRGRHQLWTRKGWFSTIISCFGKQ